MFAACEAEGDLRCATERSFLRNILLDGLSLEEERALNPYKLGVIGSTDTHTSDPGNTRSGIPRDLNLLKALVLQLIVCLKPIIQCWPYSPVLAWGLAGVWAKANTEKRYLTRCSVERHFYEWLASANTVFRWGPAGRYW